MASLGSIQFNQKVYTAEETDQKIAEAVKKYDILRYKGTVQSYYDLPECSSNDSADCEVLVGDVYNVVEAYGDVPAGTNYAWNGEEWDPLGGEWADAITRTEVEEMVEEVEDLLDSAVDGIYDDLSNDYATKEELLAESRRQDEKIGSKISGVKVNNTALVPDSSGVVSIPDASTTQKGVVQLSNSTGSTSTSQAATANAVRQANDNANGRISISDDSTVEGGNPVTAGIDFTGGVSFKSAPAVKANGFTDLVFYCDYYDPETGNTYPTPAFEMSETVADITWWDESALETKELIFNEWFSDNVYDVADQHGTQPYLSAYFSNVASFFDSVPLYYDKYDEETGDYTMEWLMDARVEFPNDPVSDGPGQAYLVLDLYRQDMESWEEGAFLGYVELNLYWTVHDGKVDVNTSVNSSDIYSQDVEGETVYPYIEYDNPLGSGYFYASTDPEGYGYDPIYEEYPDEYGWRPDIDTKLATMADISNLSESDLPDLSASKITSGTFSADRIPGLSASKITSGTISQDRLPTATINTRGILKVDNEGGLSMDEQRTDVVTIRPMREIVGSDTLLNHMSPRGCGSVFYPKDASAHVQGGPFSGVHYTVVIDGEKIAGSTQTLAEMLGIKSLSSSHLHITYFTTIDLTESPPPPGVYFVYATKMTKVDWDLYYRYFVVKLPVSV